MNQANAHRLDTKTGEEQKLMGRRSTVVDGEELPPTGPRKMSTEEVSEHGRNMDAEVERRATALATPAMGQSSLSLPSESEFKSMMLQAEEFVNSGLMPPSIKSAAAAVVMIQKGRELRVPPMQAMTSIHVIQGKPTISAELMLALIYRDCPEAEITFTEISRDRCIIQARRNKTKVIQEFSFDTQDAELAGLAYSNTWQKYPRAMRKARAITEMARTMFPDIIMGCSYTPEELGATLDVDGNVINAKELDGPVNQSDGRNTVTPPRSEPGKEKGPHPITDTTSPQQQSKNKVSGNPEADTGFAKNFFAVLIEQMEKAENKERIFALGTEIKANADKLLPEHIIELRQLSEVRLKELKGIANHQGGQQS